jgi:CBS domain containing-hemolysin-like protein
LSMLRSALTLEECPDVRYGMTQVETNIVSGALDFSKKTVGSCMTSIQDAFMLDSRTSLPPGLKYILSRSFL